MKLQTRGEYEEFMKNVPEGHCPLCNIDEQIFLGESDYWYWIANKSPYWKYNTMLIPKRHLKYFSQLDGKELVDFQIFLKKIIKHQLSLGLKYEDGKPIDQFLTMFRERSDEYKEKQYKMNHLHIHITPETATDRLKIDPEAIQINIEILRL